MSFYFASRSYVFTLAQHSYINKPLSQPLSPFSYLSFINPFSTHSTPSLSSYKRVPAFIFHRQSNPENLLRYVHTYIRVCLPVCLCHMYIQYLSIYEFCNYGSKLSINQPFWLLSKICLTTPLTFLPSTTINTLYIHKISSEVPQAPHDLWISNAKAERAKFFKMKMKNPASRNSVSSSKRFFYTIKNNFIRARNWIILKTRFLQYIIDHCLSSYLLQSTISRTIHWDEKKLPRLYGYQSINNVKNVLMNSINDPGHFLKRGVSSRST